MAADTRPSFINNIKSESFVYTTVVFRSLKVVYNTLSRCTLCVFTPREEILNARIVVTRHGFIGLGMVSLPCGVLTCVFSVCCIKLHINFLAEASVLALFGLLLLLSCPLLFHKSQLKQLFEWSTHSLLLPQPCAPFLGRDRETSDLMRVLEMQSDEVRIVNLVGSAGIGKSCLAVQVGHRLIDSGATLSYLGLMLVFSFWTAYQM